jgi:hypothetical protein
MQLHVAIAPTRLTLAALWTGGLLLSAGCRSDELQAPIQTPQTTRPPAMAVAPTSGLIGEWKLDETGGTVAHDTKNGFDASVSGGALFVAGKIGNALNLNNGTAGTGTKAAQMPSNATLDNVQEGNYTLSAWFLPATLPPDATVDNRFWAVVVKASPHMGIFYSSAGKFLSRHYLTGAVGEQPITATTYPVGFWYHVASTVNKTTGTVKIYVNGAFQDQASFAAGTAAEEYGTTPFQIGKSGTFWAANGKVDQVRIYNRELSAAEISDLFNETPAPPPGTALPAGLWGMAAADLGTLPSSGNFYKGAMIVPDNIAGSSKNINTVIANANQFNVTVMLRLSGPPGQYTVQSGSCNNYSRTKYQAQLDRFVGNTALATALSTKRAVVMVIDEPWIDSYCGSITEANVNEMGGWIKSRWPGAITQVRGPADKMEFGWTTTRTTPFSTTFWSKVDYGSGTYNHVAALDSTPAQFYQAQKTGLAVVNLGMIPGINVWNGGNKACWTQPNGTLGRIYGSQEDASVRGTIQTCSQVNEPAANSQNWVASPALLRESIDAAFTDPAAPMFLGWTHVGPDDTGNSWSNMALYESRSDFVSALQYWNTKGASRTNGTGWRTPKP